MDNSDNIDKICSRLLEICEKFLDNAKVDEGHGIDHIKAVLEHVDKALEVIPININDIQKLAIRCATILHDVDDHKFFDSSATCSNAKLLLQTVKPEIVSFLNRSASFEEFEETVKEM